LKIIRQKKIVELISAKDIKTQEELAEALVKEGFQVTQATVSRDIKELRLIKISNGENSYKYGLPKENELSLNEEKISRLMKEMVRNIKTSENIVVLHTYPGNAQTVASLVDGAKWPEVVGTVAGDDTVILIINRKREKRLSPEITKIIQRLNSMMK